MKSLILLRLLVVMIFLIAALSDSDRNSFLFAKAAKLKEVLEDERRTLSPTRKLQTCTGDVTVQITGGQTSPIEVPAGSSLQLSLEVVIQNDPLGSCGDSTAHQISLAASSSAYSSWVSISQNQLALAPTITQAGETASLKFDSEYQLVVMGTELGNELSVTVTQCKVTSVTTTCIDGACIFKYVQDSINSNTYDITFAQEPNCGYEAALTDLGAFSSFIDDVTTNSVDTVQVIVSNPASAFSATGLLSLTFYDSNGQVASQAPIDFNQIDFQVIVVICDPENVYTVQSPTSLGARVEMNLGPVTYSLPVIGVADPICGYYEFDHPDINLKKTQYSYIYVSSGQQKIWMNPVDADNLSLGFLYFEINIASMAFPELPQYQVQFAMELVAQYGGCTVDSVTYSVSDIVYVLDSLSNLFTVYVSQTPSCGYYASDVFFYPSNISYLSMDYFKGISTSQVTLMIDKTQAFAGTNSIQISVELMEQFYVSTIYEAPNTSASFSITVIDCDPQQFYFNSAENNQLWQASVEINDIYTLTIPQDKAPYPECGDFIFSIVDKSQLDSNVLFYTQASGKELVIEPQVGATAMVFSNIYFRIELENFPEIVTQQQSFNLEVTCTVTSVSLLDEIVAIMGSSNQSFFQVRYELVPDYCDLDIIHTTFIPDPNWLIYNPTSSTTQYLQFDVPGGDPSTEFNTSGVTAVTLELDLENPFTWAVQIISGPITVKSFDCFPETYYFYLGSAAFWQDKVEVQQVKSFDLPQDRAHPECGTYTFVEHYNPASSFMDVTSQAFVMSPTLASERGVHIVEFSIVPQLYPELNEPPLIQEFTFEVTCDLVEIEYLIEDIVYILGAKSTSFPIEYTITPDYCGYEVIGIEFTNYQLPWLTVDSITAQGLSLLADPNYRQQFDAYDVKIQLQFFDTIFQLPDIIESPNASEKLTIRAIDCSPEVQGLYSSITASSDDFITIEPGRTPLTETLYELGQPLNVECGLYQYVEVSNPISDYFRIEEGQVSLVHALEARPGNYEIEFYIEPITFPENDYLLQAMDRTITKSVEVIAPANGELWSSLISPSLGEEPVKQHCVLVGENWEYELPKIQRVVDDQMAQFPEVLENLEVQIEFSAHYLFQFDPKSMTVKLNYQPARKQDIGVHRMKFTLIDIYGLQNRYSMRIGIFDNSMESQIYSQVMDECDWVDKFAPQTDGTLDPTDENTDASKNGLNEVDSQIFSVEELSLNDKDVVDGFLAQQTYKSISIEQALVNFKIKNGQSLSKWDQKKLFQPLTARIKDITTQGVLTVWFSNFMDIPTKSNYEGVIQSNESYERELQKEDDQLPEDFNIAEAILIMVKMEQDETEDEEDLYQKITVKQWQVDDYDTRTVRFQLEFSKPESVSLLLLHELLVVLPPGPLFIDVYGRSFQENQLLRREIPPQIAPDSVEAAIVEAMEGAGTAAKATIALGIGSNFFISAGLNQILGVVETMQILLMPPIFKTNIPALPSELINVMMEVAHFDLVEVGEYYDQIFEMPPTGALTPSLDRIGFETFYYIHNLGALSLIMLIFLLSQVIVFTFSRRTYCGKRASQCCCFGRINKLAKRQVPKLFWNSYLQFIIESHIVVVLSGFIQIKKPLYEWPGQEISMYFGYFCMTLAGLLSVLTSVWMYRKFKARAPKESNVFESSRGLFRRRRRLRDTKPGHALRDKMTERRYGQLYADLNTKNRWICVYRFIFFLRRIQLCYVIVFEKDSFLKQLFISYFMELIYILALKPNPRVQNIFKTQKRQIVAFRDEILYILVLYHVMLFVPGYVTHEPTLIKIGYSLCGLYGLFFIMELFKILRVQTAILYLKLRRKYKIWRAHSTMVKLRNQRQTVQQRKSQCAARLKTLRLQTALIEQGSASALSSLAQNDRTQIRVSIEVSNDFIKEENKELQGHISADEDNNEQKVGTMVKYPPHIGHKMMRRRQLHQAAAVQNVSVDSAGLLSAHGLNQSSASNHSPGALSNRSKMSQSRYVRVGQEPHDPTFCQEKQKRMTLAFNQPARNQKRKTIARMSVNPQGIREIKQVEVLDLADSSSDSLSSSSSSQRDEDDPFKSEKKDRRMPFGGLQERDDRAYESSQSASSSQSQSPQKKKAQSSSFSSEELDSNSQGRRASYHSQYLKNRRPVGATSALHHNSPCGSAGDDNLSLSSSEDNELDTMKIPKIGKAATIGTTIEASKLLKNKLTVGRLETLEESGDKVKSCLSVINSGRNIQQRRSSSQQHNHDNSINEDSNQSSSMLRLPLDDNRHRLRMKRQSDTSARQHRSQDLIGSVETKAMRNSHSGRGTLVSHRNQQNRIEGQQIRRLNIARSYHDKAHSSSFELQSNQQGGGGHQTQHQRQDQKIGSMNQPQHQSLRIEANLKNDNLLISAMQQDLKEIKLHSKSKFFQTFDQQDYTIMQRKFRLAIAKINFPYQFQTLQLIAIFNTIKSKYECTN